MATLNGTSSLARKRSARLPPSSSKPAQASSRPAAPGPTSAAASTASHQPGASPTAVSNVSIFLTNLRLLDLDLRPDWPDINAHTFSAKDAAQGQKKRVQSVEWALYHLFALWDPEEARSKLQPFFPPLDQLQSLNLRAALLRCLEQAKKNGVLGRDAVIRKTMLDECKGERLEEVLAAFSSAVLKKLVAERQLNEPGHPALAQTLALEDLGYSADRSQLTALVLAHRVSLRRILDDKNAARARFREFSDLLAQKEKAIVQRREEAERARQNGQGLGSGLSEDQRRDIYRAVRNNWTGDERWMEALLYGDSKSRKDGVLSAPFDRVWRRVLSGRLAELEDEKSAGLLEQLESRVRGQQERLERWKDFRRKMFGKDDAEPEAKGPDRPSKQKGIDLGFRAHENLHLGRTGVKKLSGTEPAKVDIHYEALIDGLRSELASIAQAAPRVPSFFQRPRQTEKPPASTGEANAGAEREVVSDISDLEEAMVPTRRPPSRREAIRVSDEPAFVPFLRKASTFDYDHGYPNPASSTPSRRQRSATLLSYSPPSRRQLTPESPTSPTESPERRPTPTSKPGSPRRLSLPRPSRSSSLRLTTTPTAVTAAASPESPLSPDRSFSPTQKLADQILASVNAASPSPVKKPRHTLSLAERTRVSMARRASQASLRVTDEAALDGDDDVNTNINNNNNNSNKADNKAARERAPVSTEMMPSAESDPPSPSSPSPLWPAQGGGGTEHEDLAARTRRSLAGSEAARQRAQLERKRASRIARQQPPATATSGGRRNGYFSSSPAGEEEEEEEREGNTTFLLVEEIMNGDLKDDYEAVFMSRPKLKTSPIGTPVRELWGE